MRYQMKQKWLALGDDFTIKDGSGRDVYLVDGKAFSVADKLSFKDLAGQELAFIRQKLIALKKTYEIYRNGALFAKVTKDFSLLKDKFTVDVPGPDDYRVTGSFLDHEFTFSRNGRQVASVSKSYFSVRGSYGIDVADDEDAVTILATVVVIDLIHQDERKR